MGHGTVEDYNNTLYCIIDDEYIPIKDGRYFTWSSINRIIYGYLDFVIRH